ncbi:MAG: hypothetical protein K0Q72_3331 [Armatimonadetes bacterium]|jgi:hypothetical protein|nr:hypothetical protein [Armatimonadota bacterium]
MGAWGTAAWDNDGAADWFGELFDKTKLAARVEKTLKKKDVEEWHEEIRAAAHVLVALGRNYIWPVDVLDDHLKLAIEKLEAIKHLEELEGGEFEATIDEEIAILRSRLTGAVEETAEEQ